MTEESPTTKRRVYDLPIELVDRIVEFQKDRGLPSEVEAARRLLDQSLKNRDTLDQVVGRYLAALEPGVEPGEAAGVVLSGHPSVKSIQFIEHGIRFEFQPPNKGSNEVTVYSAKDIVVDYDHNGGGYGSDGIKFTYDETRPPKDRLVEKQQNKKSTRNLDDEIPF